MSKEIKLSAIQCFLLVLFLLVGWEVLIRIYTPTGDNWMWGQNMIIYFVGLCTLTTISNIIGSSFQEKAKIVVMFFQIIAVLIYLILNVENRPYRSTFMAIASILALVAGAYLMKYLAKEEHAS